MIALAENLSLKLAALALAIGVWFYVRGEERPVQIVSVPLEVRNLPSDLAVAGDLLESVNVRVKAPEGILKSMTPERFSTNVDLSGLEPGDHLVRISQEAMRLPPGAEVVKITPEYLSLHVEKKLTRELPVSARVSGEPAGGFVLGGTLVQPERVTVEGPESAVRLSREVLTDIVRIDGRSSRFEVMANLYPDRSGVKILHEGAALLTVNVRERYVTKVVKPVKVVSDDPSFVARFRPSTVEVTLEGPPGALEGVDAGELSAVIEGARLSLRPGDYRLKPKIVFAPASLAEKVLVRSVSAEEIAVHIASPGRPPR